MLRLDMELHKLFWFFEGTASEEEKAEIKSWIEESEDNLKEFNIQRSIHDAMVMSSVGQQKKRSSVWGTMAYSLAAACAAVLVVIGINGFGRNAPDEFQTIHVPVGQRVNVDLPDGTNVWLNAGSTLRYSQSYMSRNREVSLEGEAYFDVTRNEKLPFVVKTAKCDVTVLGTKFNVDAPADGETFETALFNGKVRIDTDGDASPMFLEPGEKATLADGRIMKSAIIDSNVYRWKDGLFCFSEMPFNQVMSSMEKYFDVRIVMSSPSLEKQVLTGKFRVSDGPEYALKVLQRSVNFEFVRENDTYYIK